MGRYRVLVVSASMGEGHDGAARELVRRLEGRGHVTRMVDSLDAPPFGLGPLSRTSYEVQLRKAPWSYDLTYNLWSVLPFLCRPFAALLSLLTRRQTLRWIAEFQPDLVVTTYPLASLVLGRLRAKGVIRVPTATFITDFAVHPLWVHRGNDLHICVHPNAAEIAERRTGRPATAPGPMVTDGFRAALPDRQHARAELGLLPGDKAVLVVAGSWGVGDVGRTFDTLASSGRYTPIAVCGHNEQLRGELARRPGGRAVGWTDRMPTLMSACDALVENAGGLTCMEAFAVGLPVVTYLPIPGHGKENGDEMERAGVAAYARTPDSLLSTLDRVTTLAGRAQVAAARAMFAGDAGDDVIALAEPAAAPIRPRRARRQRVAAAVASLAAVWSALTLGVGTAAAHGIGVARPQRHPHHAYVGARLGPAALADPALAAYLAHAGVTAIVDGALARDDPGGVRRLAQAGVDVANGGWGHRTSGAPWQRAQADLVRSGRSIRSAQGGACRTFVPGRRIDGFDLASAHLAHQRVIATLTRFPAGDPPDGVRDGGVYVLDARTLGAPTVVQALDRLLLRLGAAHLGVATLSQLH